jgi:hypothetical protein
MVYNEQNRWKINEGGNFYIHGAAIKKLDCFYDSFPATSMTKRRVGH